MDNTTAPLAMTAIAHPDSEGFISSTLFEQGWSVGFRALDADSLMQAAQAYSGKSLSLFISTDLDGLDTEKIEILKTLSQKLYLFSSFTGNNGFDGALSLPATSLELATIIRSMQRAPLIQSSSRTSTPTARIISIASAGHGYGTTTLALNIASELALQGKKTLLVDADSETPSLSLLLNQRQLRETYTWRSFQENLAVMELTQENIAENIAHLDEAANTFDFIIIDLSIIGNLSTALTGRRWSSEALIWSSKYADEMWIGAQTNLRGTELIKSLSRELALNEMRPKIRFIHMAQSLGRKSDSDAQKLKELTASVTTSAPISIPRDSKAVDEATERQITLAESNPRGVLRKSLVKLAENLSA